MKRVWLVIAAVASIVMLGGSIVTTVHEVGARSAVVTWYYNPANEPVDALAAIQSAAATWNAASPDVHFTYGGLTTANADSCYTHNDSKTVIAWATSATSKVNSISTAAGRSATGVTCGNTGPNRAGRWDVELNTLNRTWSTIGGQYAGGMERDVETVMLHEFGHGLGIGHLPTPEDVMYWNYHGDNRAPWPEDLAALQQVLYPPPAATATATKTPTATPTATPTQSFCYRNGVYYPHPCRP